MPIQKISGLQPLTIPVQIALVAASAFMLPPGQGIIGQFGGVSAPQLGSGNPLSGQYLVQLGPLSCVQVFDSNLQAWRNIQCMPGNLPFISSDGTNYRVANTSGQVVGAIVTNAGSALTNGFNTVAVTPSAGASLWNTIVGGAINTTVTITAGGTNYTRAPLLLFTPPASQGQTPYVLPSATCTISAGAINAVTVTGVGAGLVAAPTITIIPQPGDVTGGGAVLTVNATLAQSGTLLVMYPTFGGTALTAVPTFTFSPASTIAATAIMSWTITAFGGGAGATYGTTPGGVIFGGIVAGAAANANPQFDKGLSVPVHPPINVATATGVPTLAGPFGGANYQAVPLYCAIPNGTAAPGTANTNTCTMGGATDFVNLIPL